MRLGWTKNGDTFTYRAIKTAKIDGVDKTITVKKFGTDKYICKTYGVDDAKAWVVERIKEMNKEESENNGTYSIELNAGKDIPLNVQRRFNGGYLFLQAIYYRLGLHKICRAVAKKHSFKYDLNDIVSRLIYTRILFPSSKRSAFYDSRKFIEQPSFKLHDIYRSLSVIAEESDYIQSRLFKNSYDMADRKTGVIYYDCTNYYFEIDKAEDDKQYGASKEHRPLPIVEMGLFMDMDGIPISFSISAGNGNEQETMIPLEKKMIEKFDLSKFVVCTDSGLSSATNRFFNSSQLKGSQRSFITTQSIKKLKKFLADWCLATDGWHLFGDDSGKKYDITELDDEKDKDKIFYKKRYIKENSDVHFDNGKTKSVPIEQQLIVSYSIKYRNYLRAIRNGQIERAEKKVKKGESAINHKKPNDPSRFINTTHLTKDGEVAEKTSSSINQSVIDNEERFDGFYAVCTNLDDDPEDVIKVNKRRWQIEECFRIMKSDFAARPAFVKRRDRILAHFMTCFIALIVYRYLEKKLDDKYTIDQILSTLRNMDFIKREGFGYEPDYTRTELTDDLHKAFDFNTSKEIVPTKVMRNICSNTKKVTQEK